MLLGGSCMSKLIPPELKKCFENHQLWLESHGEHGYRAVLNGFDLSDLNLQGLKLESANLLGADMTGAQLRAADLTGANLVGCRLEHAGLQWTNLAGANLSEAKIAGAICNSPISQARSSNQRALKRPGFTIHGSGGPFARAQTSIGQVFTLPVLHPLV